MTVSDVTIRPHESLNNWFYVTLISRKNSIGQTTIELLVSEETLRMMRLVADKALTQAKDKKRE